MNRSQKKFRSIVGVQVVLTCSCLVLIAGIATDRSIYATGVEPAIGKVNDPLACGDCTLQELLELISYGGPDKPYPLPYNNPCDLAYSGTFDLADYAAFQNCVSE